MNRRPELMLDMSEPVKNKNMSTHLNFLYRKQTDKYVLETDVSWIIPYHTTMSTTPLLYSNQQHLNQHNL